MNAIVNGGILTIHLGYGRRLHRPETIGALADRIRSEIRRLLDYCLHEKHDAGYVEADFPQMEFAPGELQGLLDEID